MKMCIRKLQLVLSLLIFINISYVKAQFITTWQTTASPETITIPTDGSSINYDINWVEVGVPTNNGSLLGVTGTQSITLPTAGIYRITLSTNFKRIYFNNGGDKDKILTVEQWGSAQWTTMVRAFKGCIHLTIPATDAPDLSQVTDMQEMFFNCKKFNQPINHWNVSAVTNMSFMFNTAEIFNQPLGLWDVSSVVNMFGMFANAFSFNQNLNQWGNKTKNVINMRQMFNQAIAFNGDINQWDVSGVTDLRQMFQNAKAFNKPIGTWDVSKITSMYHMFVGASAFNQDLSNWDVSKVTDMSGMFAFCTAFNQPLSSWDVSKVKFMYQMFYRATNFNQPLAGWDVRNVEEINQMFRDARAFDQNIGGLKFEKVTEMYGVFWGASEFNGDISGWDVSNVTNMRSMFDNAKKFNQSLSTWEVGEVTNMRLMFWGATSFNQDISAWDVSKVTNMAGMFEQATVFNQDISAWDVSSVTQADDMLDNTALSIENYDKLLIEWDKHSLNSGVTFGAAGLKYCLGENARNHMITTDNWTINDSGTDCTGAFITTWDTDNAGSPNTQFIIPTDGTSANYNIKWEQIGNPTNYGSLLGVNGTQYIFVAIGQYRVHITGDFQNIHFNNAGDRRKILTVDQWGADIKWNSMARAFKGCTNLTVPATDKPDLSGVTSMEEMFFGATSLNNSMNDWDVSKVTTMAGMFYEAREYNQSLSNWNVSKVTTMQSMFYGAIKFNQTLNNWDVSKVTDMAGMFSSASAFNSPLLWGNKTSKVTDMNDMFASATLFNQDISGWDVSSVNDMTGMFYEASVFNQPIGNWAAKTGNVTDMKSMFEDATSFDQNISNWDVSKVTNMTRFLDNCGLNIDNYDNLLIEWNKQALQKNVIYSAVGLKYCRGKSARTDMADGSKHAWTMTGDSEACPEISVYEGPNDTHPEIIDNQTKVISFGSISGSQTTPAPITKTFAIKNIGLGQLSIYSVTVSGSTYTVANTITNVLPSTTLIFTITLPAGSGPSTATVTIRSYDEDEDPFTFVVSNDAALPITLSSFTGYAKDGRHILEWVTSSEVDNDYFVLERSANGLDYDALKTIDGKGTTTIEQHYYSIDSDPFIGKNYYRLRQVDMDGTSRQAGDVVSLINKSQLGNFGLVVYPNPTNGSSINIRLSSPDSKRDLQVRIMDIQGREFFHNVYNTTMLNKHIPISTNSNLKNGLYIIELEQGDQVTREKIIVKN